ncbi:ClpXP protease specificity-enhancing factor [Lysobacter sp. GX 14042]|uniref:ClpXP protease specificity-enhancing factor n=1 Tax=Lysobacter sp. GX 14042 TaxID=2907155 RepID=UPI001F1605E9|nr:ClpXP protease specificity-enhancing factor [Lysobacter sp. GX 14042]MCE7031797.1 ClpXP protease specificity-enhancing factor [Lysobacter sp. GX 14042]
MTDTVPAMTSHRPYLLRALYEWIADNDMTPHLLVDATRPGVQVPPGAVQDGRVVLNIAARAVAGLQMDNELISFSARFGGVSQGVRVPVGAVLAIYARETGQGMALPDEPGGTGQELDADPSPAARPGLSAVPDAGAGAETPGTPGAAGPEDGGDDDGPDSPGPRRGGHLRVVK